MGRSCLGFSHGHWAITPLLRASSSILCMRRFCVFGMTGLCQWADPLDVNHCSTDTSAGGSIFLKCSLRIFLCCHGLGYGWILSSWVSKMPRASSSPLVSQGNSASGAEGVFCAPGVPRYGGRGINPPREWMAGPPLYPQRSEPLVGPDSSWASRGPVCWSSFGLLAERSSGCPLDSASLVATVGDLLLLRNPWPLMAD